MPDSFLRLASAVIFASFTLNIYAQTPATVPPVPAINPGPNTGAKPTVPPAPANASSQAGSVPAAAHSPENKSKPMPPGATATPVRPPLQKFADNLAVLLLSLGTYNDPSPEQKTRIVLTLNNLKNLASEVQPLLIANTPDPILRYLSWNLTQQLIGVEAAFNAGKISEARSLLRHTVLYCLGTSKQSKDAPVLNFIKPPNTLSELEKAEYYTATKRYEEAMLAYERVLGDKKFKSQQPDLWEKTVVKLMAITIRIRNANITLEMSSALLEEGGYSVHQKEILQAWRTSARAWTAEPLGQKTSSAELLLKAQQVIEKGAQLSNKSSGFGNIEYMRAMSLLNEVSLNAESEAQKAKGFQLAGKASEKLPSILLWMQPDDYYEACIRSNPHSSEAKECIKLLEAWQLAQKVAGVDAEKTKQLLDLAR